MAEDKVQAGEREAVKASEEATRRNVQMILDYTNETRKMLLELKTMHDALQEKVIQMNANLNQFRIQIAGLQQKVYAGGTQDDGN